MPSQEITNNRPKAYSSWRRNVNGGCYCTDGDYFEQRKIDGIFKVVAYIETIQIPDIDKYGDYPLWLSKSSLCKDIREKMEIPAFVVYHTEDCDWFVVRDTTGFEYSKLNDEQYKEFLRGLGNSHCCSGQKLPQLDCSDQQSIENHRRS